MLQAVTAQDLAGCSVYGSKKKINIYFESHKRIYYGMMNRISDFEHNLASGRAVRLVDRAHEEICVCSVSACLLQNDRLSAPPIPGSG